MSEITPTPNAMPGASTDEADKAPTGDASNNTPNESDKGEKDWQAESEKWKALSRKHEKASKDSAAAIAELTKKVTAFEDKDKTAEQLAKDALDRATADATAAREAATQATLALKRYELVANDDDLPADVLPLLTGTTDDELAAQVAAIKATLAAKAPKRQGPVIYQDGKTPDAKDSEALALQILLGQ